ncbi:MAG: nicotinate (nicotinamide) nucleotide adenylyltransferase [Balneolaceae bacterium]
MNERIGIFGGSFNPVHTGHIRAAQSFLDSGFIQKLWVLPAAEPPHKPGEKLEPFHHRAEMLRIAFQNLTEVDVVELEKNLPKPSYTLQTFQNLKQHFPDRTFYLCIGSDTLASFTTWHRYRELLDLTELLVAERPGSVQREVPNEILEQVHFVKHDPVAISSTDIRKTDLNEKTEEDIHKKGSEPDRTTLTKEVAEYIRKNNLYRVER